MILNELRIGIGFGTIRDAVIYSFFPKLIGKLDVGYTVKCEDCGEEVPYYSYCVNCGSKNLKEISPEMIGSVKKRKDVKNIFSEKYLISDNARKDFVEFQEMLESKYNLTNNLFEVIKAIKQCKENMMPFESIKLKLFNPVRSMLFVKVNSIKEAFDTVGRPAAIEYKYDGFRLQVHKTKDKIKLYTRSLEDVTTQFPEVKDFIKANDIVLDGELIAFDKKTGRSKPFQEISQRIKRKYNIRQMIEEYPVKYVIFDILYYKKDIMSMPFGERSKLLRSIVSEIPNKLEFSKQIITDDEKVAMDFFKKSLDEGNEGIMVKSLSQPYISGRKKQNGVKLKNILDPLDLVITKAEWGEGKRAKQLSSFTVSCWKDNMLVEVGKVSTGIKEKEGITYETLTELLKPLITAEKGKTVEVEPKIIIEVGYEEIQKSPSYSSGYALRFPRFLRIRDKPLDEIATIKDIEKIYYLQRGRRKA